jgi:very-short-patch-repair endonuclease
MKFTKGYTPWNKGNTTQVIVKCETCGNEMTEKVSRLERKHFCSRECFYASGLLKPQNHCGWVKGRKFTDEHKNNISKGGQRRFENPEEHEKLRRARVGKFPREVYQAMAVQSHLKQPRSYTTIEIAVYDKLRELGIVFIEQHPINNKFIVDAYIPDKNIVIECDGDYWHSLEKVIKRDKAKNAYLTKCGYKMLRIPEHEIRSGKYVEQLMEVCCG